MGASKSGGYMKMPTVTGKQSKVLNSLLKEALPLQRESADIYRGFASPQGTAYKSIVDAANTNFQQRTIPSILNAFGSDSRGSSALNQTLAAGASDLNQSLAAQLAQMQLNSAQGLGNLGTGNAQVGTQTPQFAYQQRQQPFWQSALLGGLGAGGQALGGYFGMGR